jgi:hypothetical protein
LKSVRELPGSITQFQSPNFNYQITQLPDYQILFTPLGLSSSARDERGGTMNGPRLRALTALGIGGIVLAGFGVGVTLAQGPQAAKMPRTADGHPDLQGVWSYATITPLERPAELAGKATFASDKETAEFEEQTNARRNQDRRDGAGTDADVGRAYNHFWWDFGTRAAGKQTSLIVDPPDGRMPALTADAAKREADRTAARRLRSTADGPEDRSLWERCVTRTLPTLPGPYNNNIQIFQSRDHVVILNEMIHEARLIPLDGRPHAGVPQWRGDSRGRWEGDSLVIETTNFSEKAAFRGSSSHLRLVERYRRGNARTLLYEVTITDPTTWTRPWTVSVPMTASEEPIYEYACHEGNYGMLGILQGARAQEQVATPRPSSR